MSDDEINSEPEVSYNEVSYENFESDFDHLFIVGKPIDDQIQLTNSLTDRTRGSQDQYFDESFESVGSDRADKFEHYSSVTFKDEHDTGLNEVVNHKMPSPKKLAPAASNEQGNGRKASTNQNSDDNYKRVAVKSAGYQPNYAPVTSVISYGSKHDSVSLTKQLEAAVKKVAYYKKQNDVLLKKVEESQEIVTVQRLQSKLVEKNEEVSELNKEIQALRFMQRHQEKALLHQEAERATQSERDLSLEKQVEILMETVKRTKAKNSELKASEERLQEENQRLKEQNSRLLRKMNRAKRQIDELTHLVHQQMPRQPSPQELSAITESVVIGEGFGSLVEGGELEGSNDQLPGASLAITAAQSTATAGPGEHWRRLSKHALRQLLSEKEELLSKQFEVIAKLEKTMRMQRSGYEQELQSMRVSVERVDKERQDFMHELERRDAFIRNQILTIKQLKASYEELVEGNNTLIRSTEQLTRYHNIKQRKTSKISLRVALRPSDPKPSVESVRVQPKNAVIVEEADDRDPSVTFLTAKNIEE